MSIPYFQMQNHRWIAHFVESQLIEVRMIKMHLIQFVSILNLIQMKLMKAPRMKNMMDKWFLMCNRICW
jgi:hypothetical protein